MTNWNKEELLAYILIWCANADFIENTDETDLILSKVSEDVYKRMNKEFRKDNDQHNIDKITDTLQRLEYSSSEKSQIFNDIKEVFNADGEVDAMEQNLTRGLKRILS